MTQLTGAALGALFLAGLTAGLLCLRKMGRKSVLLWGVCGAGTVSAAALLCGCLLYGLPEPATLLAAFLHRFWAVHWRACSPQRGNSRK